MGLSFEESLKNAENTIDTNVDSSAVTDGSETISAISDGVSPTLMASAYSYDNEVWYEDSNYAKYSSYSDDNVSIMNEDKDIKLSNKQFNITQEENSQYIPFEMPRYYDGFDLVNTTISIHYETSGEQHGVSKPVNVVYNDEKIRFAWLVDAGATRSAGKLKFEIHATGVTSDNKGNAKSYVWKSKYNDSLNVLQSLCDVNCEGIIDINDSWVQELVTAVAENVAQQIADIEVAEQVTKAENAAASAETSANAAEQSAINAASAATTAVESALGNYATKEYVDSLDISGQLVDYAKTEYVDEQITNIQNNYYNKTETDQKIASDLENYATKDDVADAISSADLDSYYKKTETYNRTEIDEKVSNVTVDLTGYATETYVDNKENALSSSIETNASNISSLSSTVGELQNTVNSIDTSPRLTYDVAYNDIEDADVGENVFVFYEIENEGTENEVKEAKKKFTIVGGGGTSTSSTLKISYVTTSPFVITSNDEAIIKYIFSGTDSSGDIVPEGTATWKVNGKIVATNTALNGENSFDITDYISVGTQKVNLTIIDEAGSLVTKTWTVQKIDVRIESTFNDKITYPIGTVLFDYTPYGSVSKDIHFILDNVEIGKVSTSSSGIPMSYEIPEQEHGAHLLEVYMTAEINGNTIESNHIIKDIIWYDSTSNIPVISTVYQSFEARQYDTTNIEYTVYDPNTESPTVEIAVDDVVMSTQVLSTSTAIYPYKTDVVGTHTITITCGETVKTLIANITKLDIDISPVTAGLVFDFNPVGKSNNDTDRLWSNSTVSMSVSDNFDWVNGGYQIDENGDQYFCIKAGTSAVIDYQLFADDAKKNGKEFKLVFKTVNVKNPSATFLSCVDNTTETDHIGIRMDVHEAYIYGQAGNLFLPYSEEDIIEFEFNISKNTEAVPMVMGYEDGVSTSPLVYDSSYNFTQNTPKYISLGSEDCDLYIYRFKVYNTSLTDRGILNNFIADARNAEEMVSRYNRNQIYDENNNLDPDILAEKCPHLRIIKLEAPYFTNNKSDKVPNTTIEYIYKNGDPVLDNWKAYNSMHSGQGTSSNNYGAAGRNLDLIMNKSGIDGVKPDIVLGDGITHTNKVSLTRDSVEANYFNVKVNIASSENANNALLQRRYNTYNPYNRPFVRDDETEISKIKDTMEFYNCVVFIKETDTDLSTHREFADNEWHFYGIGNIGDSKKTDKTRLTDPDDKYEFCVEIMDVEYPNSDFPAGEEALANLEADPFDESMTYGLRYIWEDGTDEENAEVLEYVKTKWKDFYKFVVNSTDEEFHSNLGDYFMVDSALYYYLFTTRYLMIDNRAKNTFWHYGKTGEVDAEGNPIRKFDLCWDYDNDSALGINNYGDLVYRYGLEDTDVDENGEEVFRESDSTFFCRVRDLFANELKTMYNTLESQNAWHGESFINQFDTWQAEFPEELWRIDIERKYIRTYNSSFINGAGDSQFLVNMAKGRKKYQRRQFERNQEKYMASKFQSSVASSDNAVLRCTVPSGDLVVQPNYKLKLTPYAYMYLNVKYGTGEPIQIKAEPNVEYEIPFTGNSADIIDIYSSSLLTSLGDLSPCYAGTIDTRSASKLKELIIGNSTVGYDNPYLTTLTLGANYLLEKLNVENVSGLTQSLDLSVLNNLRELYAHGSNAGGVTFADGGRIEIAELPDVNAITMKNLIYLTRLDITSFDKLTTLTVENCNTIDLLSILNSANNINRVRITNINWTLDDTSLLKRLYAMSGIDKNGYNINQSVLTGTVYVPVIGQQELYEYQEAWSDLTIVPNTIIQQFAVTFKNEDGTILDAQYVDIGGDAVDPITREENPIATPTKDSTVQYDYTFEGWDMVLTSIFDDRIITATYSESLRSYTIRYVSKGTVLQENTGLYGDNILYEGAIPTYTLEESAYKYYLFNRWDKSGFIDGDKTVNAIFDSFQYTDNYFVDKELSNLSTVEIYALTKLGLDNITHNIQDGDDYSLELGYDVDYDDIESKLIISDKTVFNGTNYVDTGIKLFDEDKDFVLAIDYKMSSENTLNNVLAQCFQSNGSNGFKLWYNSTAKFTWGTSTSDAASSNKREMIVIRHKKGENNLTIYNSNLDSTEFTTVELTRTKDTITDSTLVFGCAKADDGAYENYAVGNIYWCKIWYKDLGEKACEKLVGWTHEKIGLEVCGFKKYYLSDNPSKRCTFSLLATNLLERSRVFNSTNTTVGGWASSALNNFLNTRLYDSMSDQIKSLLKQVTVSSSIGNKSTEISTSNCYVTIPSLIEVTNESPSDADPYINEGSTISYMISNDIRKRAYVDGDYASYWLRSPNASYASYMYTVKDDGSLYGFVNASNKLGVLIEISF